MLSMAIDKHLYIACRYLPPFFEMKHRVVWSKIENVRKLDEIEHPAIREGMRFMGFSDDRGLEIHYQADLPARSGMGSSSSFAVDLINALSALKSRMIGKQELTQKAIELEQDLLREAVGSQDQVAAAFGGLNRIDFRQTGEIEVQPLIVSPKCLNELVDHIMLFYTGSGRFSFEIAAKVINNIPNRQTQLRRIYDMVAEGVGILGGSGPVSDIGLLLDEAWQLKRDLSTAVSNDHIDSIYQAAKQHGAIGGKMLGAGGAGFMMVFAAPGRHQDIKAALADLLYVPVRVSPQGSTIIHYENEDQR